jgi:hypothetical protein
LVSIDEHNRIGVSVHFFLIVLVGSLSRSKTTTDGSHTFPVPAGLP